MDLKYVARHLLRRPGHTLAVIACLVIGLVAPTSSSAVSPALRASRIDPIATLRQE